MGADNHSRSFSGQALDAPPDLMSRHGIETGGWFVEKNQSRRMD
jgi:hypothetical protein